MLFKCKHPARWLGVQKPETVQIKDADFDVVTYHLTCRKCGAPVSLSYAKMIDGIDAFLASRVRRGPPVGPLPSYSTRCLECGAVPNEHHPQCSHFGE